MKALLATILLTFTMTAAASGPPNEYITHNGSQCDVAGTNGGDPNHVVDKRSIGIFNKSTTGSGVFIICPFTVTPTPVEGGALVSMYLSAFTIDGAQHSMTCTAVVGSLNRPTQPIYGSKTVTVTSADPYNGTLVSWSPADLGGASPTGGIVGSAWGSITCNVPAQTAIALYYARLNDAIE